MADFEFDVGALVGVQKAGEQLLKEQEEANTARRARDETIQRLAQEKLQIAKGAQQVAIDTAQRATEHLDSMDANLKRVNEINDSFMLRLVEPLADGLGLKNYSRKELLRDVQTEDAALQNSMARAKLEEQKLNAKDLEIQSKAAAADAKLAAETGDVTSLASTMETLKQLRVDAETAREGMIANANDAELGQFAKEGIISEQRYKEEVQARTSKALTLQSQKNAAYLQNFQIQEATISALSDEDLRNPEKVKGMPAAFVEEEIRRRSGQEMAWQQQRLSLQASEMASAFATMDDEALTDAGKEGKSGVTPYAAEEEKRRRELQRAIDARRKADAELNAAANKETAKKEFLANATISQLEEGLYAGGGLDKGVVTFKGPDGMTMEIDSSVVAAALKLKSDVRQEAVLTLAGAAVAEPALNNTIGEIERVLGVQPTDTEGVPLNERIDAIYKRNDLPADVRTGLDIVRKKYGAAEKRTLGPVTSTSLMMESVEHIAKTRDTLLNARLATTGKSNAVGMKEYYETGKISKVESSLPIAATAAVVGESTGNILYDSVTQTLQQSLVGQKDDNKSKSYAQQMLEKDLTPAERAASALTQTDTQQLLAKNIADGVVVDAHVRAFREMGHADIARQLQAGLLSRDGKIFSEADVLAVLQKQNIDTGKYLSTLLAAAPLSAKELMTPRGENAHIMAAYNKLFFNNQTEIYAQDFVMARMQDAIRGQIANRQVNQGLLDPTSQFGL